jgi:hypothetical protein
VKHKFDDDTWVEVEEVATATSRRAKARKALKAERHIGCPRSWLKRVYTTTHGRSDVIVALHLYHWRVVRKSKTVTVTNAELAEYGINRLEKSRSLGRLEKAGLVKVDRRDKRAPRVTLLALK